MLINQILHRREGEGERERERTTRRQLGSQSSEASPVAATQPGFRGVAKRVELRPEFFSSVDWNRAGGRRRATARRILPQGEEDAEQTETDAHARQPLMYTFPKPFHQFPLNSTNFLLIQANPP